MMYIQGDHNVNMKAETGVMLLQAKNASHHQHQYPDGRPWNRFFLVDTLISDF